MTRGPGMPRSDQLIELFVDLPLLRSIVTLLLKRKQGRRQRILHTSRQLDPTHAYQAWWAACFHSPLTFAIPSRGTHVRTVHCPRNHLPASCDSAMDGTCSTRKNHRRSSVTRILLQLASLLDRSRAGCPCPNGSVRGRVSRQRVWTTRGMRSGSGDLGQN
jgi:hypothetical protein